MSTYYEYQSVKVKIAHRLMKMDGWKVYGYHADNSDSMTDYYDPAYWDGIAEKNGYRLVIDKQNQVEDKTETRTRYNNGNLSFSDLEKIKKLEAMTTERGASAQEAETAQRKNLHRKQKTPQKPPQSRTQRRKKNSHSRMYTDTRKSRATFSHLQK